MSGEPLLVPEGRRLVELASAAGLPARLFGGVAIWLRSTPPTRAALGRDYADIDLVAHRRDSRPLRELLEEAGYEPERMLLADDEVADSDGPARLNVARVSEVCAADWGLYTTASDNLARLREMAGELTVDGAALTTRIDALVAALEEAPKSARWRMRARIGRRKRWYETPEEIAP